LGLIFKNALQIRIWKSIWNIIQSNGVEIQMKINNTNIKIILSIILFAIQGAAFAGSRGVNFVLINIGDLSFYKSDSFYGFGKLDESESCWYNNVWSGIDVIALNKTPNGLTKEKVEKLWNGDYSEINLVRKILHTDDGLARREGYDGLIIIKPEGDKISVLGIGANSTKKQSGISKKYESLPLHANDKKQGALDLNNALCKVVKPFEIGFGY